MPYPVVRHRRPFHPQRLLAGLALLALGACVSAQQTTPTAPPQPPPTAPAPVATLPTTPARVGLLLPLSGNVAQIGQDMLDAAQMALFDVGDNDVVLLPRDTGEDQDTAAAAARQVLGEGAELILGPLFGNATRAVSPIAAQAGVTVLSFSNDAASVAPNVFVLGFRPEEQVERVVRYAHRNGLTRLALLAPDDIFGQLAARAFSRVQGELGIDGQTSFYPANGDPSEGARGLLASGEGGIVDAVLVADTAPRAIQVVNSLGTVPGAAGARPLGTSRWSDDPGLATAAQLTGAWFAAVDPNRREAFRQRFLAVFGRTPHELAALAYDATALSVLLARSDRSYAAATLTDPQGFAGSLGAFRLRADGTAEHRLAILEVQPPTVIVVDPQPADFSAELPPTN